MMPSLAEFQELGPTHPPTHAFTFKEINKKSMLNDFNKGLDMGNVLMEAGFDWLA